MVKMWYKDLYTFNVILYKLKWKIPQIVNDLSIQRLIFESKISG